MRWLTTLKSKIIYVPRLLYPVVFLYARFIFHKDFKVLFPAKELRQDSTHFIFLLISREDETKYIVKFRNIFGDMYFQKHTGVHRLSKKEYIKLIRIISEKGYMKEIFPGVRIYKERVLWNYLEDAETIDSPSLHMSLEEKQAVWDEAGKAIDLLKKDGIIYGRIKRKHILVREYPGGRELALIDWDTARYTN